MNPEANSPELSVVVCTYNRADQLARALDAVDRQTIRSAIEVVVVNDGSTDNTLEVARRPGVHLVTHEQNLGVAAARNTGWRNTTADLVAYTDDDCEPDPEWAQALVDGAARHPTAAGLGGQVQVASSESFLERYLVKSNPLAPLEQSLFASDRLLQRLALYLKRSAQGQSFDHERPVASLIGANMAFRRKALLEADGYDERFRFGGEEEDLCRRLIVEHDDFLVLLPGAIVRHYFKPGLRDTLRRSRAYGRGNARMYLKHRNLNPTLYPAPVAVLGSMLLVPLFPVTAIATALLLPQILFSRWIRSAKEDPISLTYAYVQTLQETASNIGWVEGWWQERALFRATCEQ